MKIAIGNDHVAVEMKNEIKAHLEERGIEVINFGTDTPDSVHYPTYGHLVGKAVASGEADLGIVCCGTGIGIGMAAGKVPGIRCALPANEFMAQMAKEHNNANVLAFGARTMTPLMANRLVDAWLDAEHLGGRHAERVAMIEDLSK